MGSRTLRTIVLAVVDEHRVLLILVAAYVAAGGAALAWMRQPWPVLATAVPLLVCWVAGTAMWLLCAFLKSPKAFRACLEPTRALGAVVVLVLLAPFHATFQSLKQAIGPVVGFLWDPTFARWDEALHGGPAWRLLAFAVDSRTAVRTLDVAYMLWFLLLLVVPVWGSWTPHRALRQRALIAFALLWMVAGTVAAFALASAGPCYLDRPEYRDLVARLDAHGFLFARHNERGLWEAQQLHHWLPFGGISAMPSLHVGFVVLVACVAWQRARWLAVLIGAYAAAILIGSVVLAWHYAIDGYIGAALASAMWVAVNRLGGDKASQALYGRRLERHGTTRYNRRATAALSPPV